MKKRKRRPSFFKFFLPSFTDKCIEVPKGFLKHLKGVHSGTAKLKGPSGKIWRVELAKKNNNRVFLRKGWKRFVNDHFVDIGYCLVFKYCGKLRFNVKIFSTSACEKLENSHVNSSRQHTDDGMKGWSCPNSLSLVRFDGDDCSIGGNSRGQPSGEENKSGAQRSTKEIYQTKVDIEGTLSITRNSGHRGSSPSLLKFISQRRPVTEKEIQRAYNAAKLFKSRYPFWMVVMRPSYVYTKCLVNIPAAFVRSSLPKVPSLFTLCDPNGKEWKIRYICNKNYGSGFISAGWAAFTFGNNIEEGDVCVFELTEDKKMQVYIYRVIDEIAPLIKFSKRYRRSLLL